MQLLLVEDDLDLVDALSRVLASRGLAPVCCADGQEALALVRKRSFDVIVLDLSLPGMDGLEVLQRIRDAGMRVPVLVVTARGTPVERVQGLTVGADDYLTKPFDTEELVARIKALVRRSQGVEEFRCGHLQLDTVTGAVLRSGRPLDIAPREAAMLRTLMTRPGRPVSRDDLFAAVFGDDASQQADAVDVLAHRLRKRLLGTGTTLLTMRGVGYLLVDELASPAQEPA
ncbi:two-component system response regulator [Rhodoferax sp. TH121]|uniref:response regulator transcription factor n=1 Tax=Rhodoferax sp. TH121 TaxID=2022803 RepID=UPI000B974AB4|nr:response regulator transcription factor [Rhodoferax sp. TH121]OYQ41355.1 two-component system response regulator [Rhodoferax sp. TH121]